MHSSLEDLPEKILNLSLMSLRRANTDIVYYDPRNTYREFLAPLSAAHAGELLLKAIIAKEHPLLIFDGYFEKNSDDEIDLDWLLSRGKTHNFSKLPNVMWAASGTRLPDPLSFKKLGETRNKIQHFTIPEMEDLRSVASEFIYKNIDPLLKDTFGHYACLYHEDEFDDYVVEYLVRTETRFSIPKDLALTEIYLCEVLCDVGTEYAHWFEAELGKLDLGHLLTPR